MSDSERKPPRLVGYASVALVLTFGVLPGRVAAVTPLSHRSVVSMARDALVTGFATGNLLTILPVLAERARQLLQGSESTTQEMEATVDVFTGRFSVLLAPMHTFVLGLLGSFAVSGRVALRPLRNAEGYAVFNLVSSKIFLLATGNGFGVATDNRTGKNTFMRMVEAGGGVGMGFKIYKSVYVFNDRAAFEAFTRGAWQGGGDADVGAEYEGKGVSAGTALTTDELARPVTVYQFTDKGVSLAAAATGTRYYPDAELN